MQEYFVNIFLLTLTFVKQESLDIPIRNMCFVNPLFDCKIGAQL